MAPCSNGTVHNVARTAAPQSVQRGWIFAFVPGCGGGVQRVAFKEQWHIGVRWGRSVIITSAAKIIIFKTFSERLFLTPECCIVNPDLDLQECSAFSFLPKLCVLVFNLVGIKHNAGASQSQRAGGTPAWLGLLSPTWQRCLATHQRPSVTSHRAACFWTVYVERSK